MGVYDILYSGLAANQQWMEVTANNITNINTTRTKDGGSYHRQAIVMESKRGFEDFFDNQVGKGVEVTQVVQDPSENIVHDPTHPDADADGNVRMPAITLAAEMTNIVMAQRAYQANVTTLNAMKEANDKTNEIGKV